MRKAAENICYNSGMKFQALQPIRFTSEVRAPAKAPRPGKRVRYVPTRTEVLVHERKASLVRNVLISRLDVLMSSAGVRSAREKYQIDGDQWLGLLEAVQLALFPEEFATPSVEEKEAKGLIPRGGRIGRVSWEQFEAFANNFLCDVSVADLN